MQGKRERFVTSLVVAIINTAILISTLFRLVSPLSLLPITIAAGTWLFNEKNLKMCVFGSIVASVLIIVCAVLGFNTTLSVPDNSLLFNQDVAYLAGKPIPYLWFSIPSFCFISLLYIGDIIFAYKEWKNEEKKSGQSGTPLDPESTFEDSNKGDQVINK